ncbi:hypothetical protein KAJ02_01805, partial [Candidatus Bipolaricaulota bacterium]|nr:hypothetical protein [Candidatus Bipolaricaulota bacterium]
DQAVLHKPLLLAKQKLSPPNSPNPQSPRRGIKDNVGLHQQLRNALTHETFWLTNRSYSLLLIRPGRLATLRLLLANSASWYENAASNGVVILELMSHQEGTFAASFTNPDVRRFSLNSKELPRKARQFPNSR